MRSYRWAEVVSHLVGHGDVGDGWWHVFPVVEQRDHTRVQALEAPAVVLHVQYRVSQLIKMFVFHVQKF